MSYCPNCNEDFDGELTTCPRCNAELDPEFNMSPEAGNKGWIIIGHVKDQTTADYARETLESEELEALFKGEELPPKPVATKPDDGKTTEVEAQKPEKDVVRKPKPATDGGIIQTNIFREPPPGQK